MAEQLLSCEHPTSRNPSSKKQGNKPARTAGKRPVRQLRYLRLTIFDSLWRLCVSFFLSVARRRLQQFAASFRQPPHAGDCLLLPAVIMSPSKSSRLAPPSARHCSPPAACGRPSPAWPATDPPAVTCAKVGRG